VLLKKTQIPHELVRLIATILLNETVASAGSIESRFVSLGYGRIHKLLTIVTMMTRLQLNETRSVRINGLTSLERKALYQYMNLYGGITIDKLPKSKPVYILTAECQWCKREESFVCLKCRDSTTAERRKNMDDVSVVITRSGNM